MDDAAEKGVLGIRARGSFGFTLIELLIVILLLLAVSALVAPAMIRSLDERRFEAAIENVHSQLLIARARAQIQRSPIQVLYRQDPPRIIVGEYAPDEDESSRLSTASIYSIRLLYETIRITTQFPENREESLLERADLPPLAGEPLGFDEQIEPEHPDIVLAVYLPDGSALWAQPIWLIDDDDRVSEISINRWTGLPVLHQEISIRSPVEETTEHRDDEGQMP